MGGIDWDLYCGRLCISKQRFDLGSKGMVNMPLGVGAGAEPAEFGVAHATHKFAEGAERVVFQCTEVVSFDGGRTAHSVGPRLVAKEARHVEHMGSGAKFHSNFCRTQGVDGAAVC